MSSFSWMAAQGITDYHVEHVFGRNSNIDSNYNIVSNDGFYRTPLFSAPVNLRIKAGDANDDVAGTGARKIRLVGSGLNNEVVIEDIETAGTSASAPTVQQFVRLQRAYVVDSGTHAENLTFSHAGIIIIETTGGEQWSCIDTVNIARAQTQIGAFTIPSELPSPLWGPGTKIKSGLITGYAMTVDSGKSSDFIIMQRPDNDILTAPFPAMKMLREHLQIIDVIAPPLTIPLGPFAPGTDIIVLAKGVTTAAVSVDLEIALVRE